ncbi:MAG: hypothetical protein A2637_02770 [Candidatus Muproteobacteria bacterium RIFCSPHIGHO2_01_FULL_65_16]|uniref:DNA polymerase III subunit chi n=2 Tax=Candidatus Muproteobacteria TaxID=1817795 RepID=A0A1F6TL26_9PROT|nr:MAG: hypothetical protein A2637_02770 [Candidatus Muproteobacteria bacterium RIFCSPHIGHO2_01_FULL_65_16]OGI51318.1 MAG: hypothetical protein A3B81_00765 [Candidatus Muproteobacteria bacterium RIFCSPHIGHO2_02_FULL_65_16]
MTRIDFYLLGDGAAGGMNLAACRLTDKAFRLGHRIYILATDAEHSRGLDQLLWTFSAGSFIPHALNSDAADAQLPVLVGHDDPPAVHADVLITLAARVPECFPRFQRVAEVVGNSDVDKHQARERFRFYRERGCELHTHNL